MKKLLGVFIIFIFAFTSATDKQYNFKFTEKEATQIIQSIQNSEMISAKDANVIINKIQQQASDTLLNPKIK